MAPRILQVLAFFYMAITTSQATCLLLPLKGLMIGAVGGKIMFKGALYGGAGLAAVGAVHKHLEDYWNQKVGGQTKMPTSIKNCMLNGNTTQQGGVDEKSLIRFMSVLNGGKANLGGNVNQNINQGSSTSNSNQGQTSNIPTSSTPTGQSLITPTTETPSSQGQPSTNDQASTYQGSSNWNNQGSSQTSNNNQGSAQTLNNNNDQGSGISIGIGGSVPKNLFGPPRSSPSSSSSFTENNSQGGGSKNTHGSSSFNTVGGSGEYHFSETTVTTVETSVQSMFFVENDLSLGKKMNVHFLKSTNMAPFLPREMLAQLSFTEAKFPEILQTFNLSATSQEATILKETLKYCEDDKPGDKCCTSLETMIDFATSVVGQSVKAISTNIDRDMNMQYKVQGIKKMPVGQQAVTCHKVPFPCAVFYCQKVEKMSVFIATLVGTDGSTINAPAVCDEDTSTWDQGSWIFQAIHAKPGSCPVCHFLLDDDVLWMGRQ